jgi:hypothetical protein
MSKKSPTAQQLERLIRNWERYREKVTTALAAEQSSERDERDFLRLKAELAAQIQWLSETLPRSMAYETHQGADVMADLVRRHVTLCAYDMDQRWELRDFENTWHQHFIYLNRLRGTELGTAKSKEARADGAPSTREGSGNRLGWILAFAFAGFLLYLLASAAGLSWGASGPTFMPPETLHQAFSNAGNVFASLWAGPSRLFEPLETAYGSQWALGLVAALAVVSGAFLVFRGQN